MMEIGLRAKRSRPLMPMYLLRHPADHNRTAYSQLKNTTSTISCKHTHIVAATHGDLLGGTTHCILTAWLR